MKTTIMIHCLDTPKNWRKGETNQSKLDEVKRWHVQGNGWADIAYAYVIFFDGQVLKGRDLNGDGNTWDDVGAGAKGHNKHVIHIALEGGKNSSANDRFPDHFTSAQNQALRALIQELQELLGPLKVNGHNDVAARACPGFKVNTWYNMEAPRSRTESKTATGGIIAAAGTAGSAGLEMATNELQNAAGEVKLLTEYAPFLQWLFIGLTLAGIALVLYRRLVHDWNRGHR